MLRPAYVSFLKTGWWNTKFQTSWSHKAPWFTKIHNSTTPQSHLLSTISMWDTLYLIYVDPRIFIWMSKNVQYNSISIYVDPWIYLGTHQCQSFPYFLFFISCAKFIENSDSLSFSLIPEQSKLYNLTKNQSSFFCWWKDASNSLEIIPVIMVNSLAHWKND